VLSSSGRILKSAIRYIPNNDSLARFCGRNAQCHGAACEKSIVILLCCARNARGQGALRELLNPLVTTVLDDPSLHINTNPVEVYKQWINQTEAETGQTRWVASSVCESMYGPKTISHTVAEGMYLISGTEVQCEFHSNCIFLLT